MVVAPSQSDEESFERRKREYESLATSLAAKRNCRVLLRTASKSHCLPTSASRKRLKASRNTILPALAYFVPSFSFSNRTNVRALQVQVGDV